MNLSDHAKKYYGEKRKNCAVAIFLGASNFYKLGLTEEDAKLVNGFGGGIGCGYVCGCLAGSVAVLGKMFSDGENVRTICADFVKLFEQKMGAKNCQEVLPLHFSKEKRCLGTVDKAACLLEEYISTLLSKL